MKTDSSFSPALQTIPENHIFEEQLSDPLTEQKVYSILEFTEGVNALLHPLYVTVQGEIHEIKRSPNRSTGEITNGYITLTDKSRNYLPCYVWLPKVESSGLELKEGMEVQVTGLAQFKYSSFKFNIDFIAPVGEGALRLQFEKLKKQLDQDGYFDPRNKRKIPPFIHRIGLLTSDGSDAQQDFYTHMGKHGYKIFFKDTRVDGIQALPSLLNGIRNLNESSFNLDVIVITRGGGGLQNLQAFNTLEIANAIRGCRVPVITAIGHDKNTTIADLVGDLQLSTGTDAGKFVSQPWTEAKTNVAYIENNIYSTFKHRIEVTKNSLQYKNKELIDSYGNILLNKKQYLVEIEKDLLTSIQSAINDLKATQETFNSNYKIFVHHIKSKYSYISNSESNLKNFSLYWFKRLQKQLNIEENQLQIANPLRILEQGYSIVYNEVGKVVKSTDELELNSKIKIKLHRGIIKSTINEMKNE